MCFVCFEGSILQLQQFCFSELAYKQLSENKFPCSLCDDIMASLKDVKFNFYISQKISKLQLIGSDRFTVFCSSFFYQIDLDSLPFDCSPILEVAMKNFRKKQ